jgi:HEPN domain-containing protein
LIANHRNAVACFLAQQAAEKALNGLLYAAGAEVVLGHSVAALCREVAVVDPDLAPRCAA